MAANTKRQHLKDFQVAARKMELAEVCVGILEEMSGAAAQRCIKTLKAEQRRVLKQMDVAAEKLGAPYVG